MIVLKTDFKDLALIRRGKVRDVYDLGESLLFVATDRISAFDVVMNEPIPEKGVILTSISEFWFENTREMIENHFISSDINEFPAAAKKYSDVLEGRSMIVKKCKPLAVECIVRGYVAGSGWKEYQLSGTICGEPIAAGLREYEVLPEPIFTPSTKADEGHDENINFEHAVRILGAELAENVRQASLDLYKFAADYLFVRGIILADTKFEFGIDSDGSLILIDEALTPDSSRFWLKEDYAAGRTPTNFDKQILRDYLESLTWDKQPPPPTLPKEIINGTLSKYKMALEMITSAR